MSTPSRRECLAAFAAPLFAFFDRRPSPVAAPQIYITPERRPTELQYLISGPFHTKGTATYTIGPEEDELTFNLTLFSPTGSTHTFRSRRLPDGLRELTAQYDTHADDAYVHAGQNVLSYFADIAGLYAANGTIDSGITELVVSYGQRLRFQTSILPQQQGDLAGILVQPVSREGQFDPIAFSKLFEFTGVELYLDSEGVCQRARALFTNGTKEFAYYASLQR